MNSKLYNLIFEQLEVEKEKKAKCKKKKASAIIRKFNNSIKIFKGFNKPARKIPQCKICSRNDPGYKYLRCITIHSEIDALFQAILSNVFGPFILLTEVFPCCYCLPILFQNGVCNVVYKNYHSKEIDKEMERIYNNIIFEKFEVF